MAKRRVVVTGLGLVTPLGCGVETVWRRLLAGESGLARIEHFDVSDLSSHVAGIIPRLDGRNGGGADVEGSFDPDAVMPARERKRIDEFILYAIAAADEAGLSAALRDRRPARRLHRPGAEHGDHLR